MQKFIQYTPTEILFGENTQAEVGKEVKKWGGSRVFIVYGGGSVKKKRTSCADRRSTGKRRTCLCGIWRSKAKSPDGICTGRR